MFVARCWLMHPASFGRLPSSAPQLGKLLCFRCRRSSCGCVAALNGQRAAEPGEQPLAPTIRGWALALGTGALLGGLFGALVALIH